MLSFIEPKTMAKALRRGLAQRKVELSHSDCLELVARQCGLADWNTLAAKVESTRSGLHALPTPDGWFATRMTDLDKYRLGIDPASRNTALIECRLDRESGVKLAHDDFASLMQSISAEVFRGKRLRLTAEIRTEDADSGSIWMRIDGELGDRIAFDNLLNREIPASLNGTSSWVRQSIVLDVPERAWSIHYGLLLGGYGSVWARSFQLAPVGMDVPTTEMPSWRDTYPSEPLNLDLSQA